MRCHTTSDKYKRRRYGMTGHWRRRGGNKRRDDCVGREDQGRKGWEDRIKEGKEEDIKKGLFEKERYKKDKQLLKRERKNRETERWKNKRQMNCVGGEYQHDEGRRGRDDTVKEQLKR